MVIGHDVIRDDFTRLLERGRLAHAYLFFGPDGVGKRSFAEELAQYLEQGSWPEQHTRRPLTDAMFVVPNSSGTIGIDDARAIRAFLMERPLVSTKRTVIVDKADALTPEAQNALLKITEEPPASSLLFLVVRDPELLMPTLVSRLQNIYFSRLRDADLKKWLAAEGIKGAEADRLAEVADGKPGVVRTMLRDEVTPERDSARAFLGTAPAARKDFVKALVEPENFSFRAFLDALILEISASGRRNSGLWHAVVELRQMAEATGLSPRIQLMNLGTYL